MLRLLRIALLLILTLLALGLIVATGSPETGPAEKVILVGAVFAVLAAGAPVRRIGGHS